MIRLAGIVAAGGVALFPADTVYGLACDPEDEAAFRRIYELKGRAPEKPAAVMWFHRDAVDLAMGERTRGALDALLPGPVTLLLPNPERRYPLACGPDPSTIGVRVPDLPEMAYWRRPIAQTSANLSGGPEARRLQDVPESIRAGVDVCIDGGELPGIPSTVIDLRRFEDGGEWDVVREGALGRDDVARAVGALA